MRLTNIYDIPPKNKPWNSKLVSNIFNTVTHYIENAFPELGQNSLQRYNKNSDIVKKVTIKINNLK